MRDEPIEPRLPDTLNEWAGVHQEIFEDATPELEVEGSRMCAKTTLLLDKEISFLRRYPGIKSMFCRYSETACATKLRPRFEELCAIRKFIPERWDSKELCYHFANGSKMYAFGLKAANASARYEKLRGLDVARLYVDQAEELPGDIGQELRASLRQKGYPHQITFSPNPVPRNHWLADKRHGGFPLDNSFAGRRHFQLSIYDNRYNLPPESVAMMERTYPPDHAKHGAMILGVRGPNVVGEAIFEEPFRRDLHVRPIAFNPEYELYEAFEFGKHNPCVVFGQRLYAGGLVLLGGIMGEGLFLDEFIPTVQQYRAEWFPRLHAKQVRTCCTAPGANIATNGSRFTSLQILRMAKYNPIFRDGSNAHDVNLALLEQLAGYMRRRNVTGQESFGINNDPTRWLAATIEGVEQDPFMAHAFEANAVWDEHLVSVGNHTVRQMHEDDMFANAIHAVQSIEVNFCAERPTQQDRDKRAAAARAAHAQREPDSPALMGPLGWMA